MRKNFYIVAERAPVRCDICHQAGEFDAASGRCGRCSHLSVPKIGMNQADADVESIRWKARFRKYVVLAIVMPIVHCLSRLLWWFVDSPYSNPIADRISENSATFILVCVLGMFYLSVFFEVVFLVCILRVWAEGPKAAQSQMSENVRTTAR